MSIIHVSRTTSLFAAFQAKTNNTTVSTKTQKKIEELAACLYGVSNNGKLRRIDSPLGKAAFERDIKASVNAVAAMPDGPARRSLSSLLENIETRTTKTLGAVAADINGNDVRDGIYNLKNNILLPYIRGAKPE
ncbi:hypothetical protein [Pinirhizobacter soli]|uniref:hypothetical protein n=1 Tax=Pinirhizobacter soli TaxID=2786953 RepID=UPI00202A2426|nr:hypothetical protein [Pinirhizobacter soli]